MAKRWKVFSAANGYIRLHGAYLENGLLLTTQMPFEMVLPLSWPLCADVTPEAVR
jgi:hypothetical protein